MQESSLQKLADALSSLDVAAIDAMIKQVENLLTILMVIRLNAAMGTSLLDNVADMVASAAPAKVPTVHPAIKPAAQPQPAPTAAPQEQPMATATLAPVTQPPAPSVPVQPRVRAAKLPPYEPVKGTYPEHRERIRAFLLSRSNEPMRRSTLMREVKAPMGGLTFIFRHPMFKIVEDGLVCLDMNYKAVDNGASTNQKRWGAGKEPVKKQPEIIVDGVSEDGLVATLVDLLEREQPLTLSEISNFTRTPSCKCFQLLKDESKFERDTENLYWLARKPKTGRILPTEEGYANGISTNLTGQRSYSNIGRAI